MADNDQVITEIRNVATKVDKINEDVTEIRVKVAVMGEKMHSREAERVPERIQELETFRTKIITYIASASFVMSILMSFVMVWLKKIF